MAILDDMPKGLAATLAQPPHPGERNVWLFQVAINARHVASAEKVRRFLAECVAQYRWGDRDFSGEINRAVDRAFDPKTKNTPAPRRVPMPDPLPEQRIDAIARRFRDQILFDATDSILSTREALSWLFRDDDWVCTAKGDLQAATSRLKDILHYAHTLEFLVANPMWARRGLNQDGDHSFRCRENAPDPRGRRHLVVEFDHGSLDRQAALLSALHSPAHPLIMVVYSGGKSLHGWFDVRELPYPKHLPFFQSAVKLGADASLWDTAKLVRMPGGVRKNSNPQPILYANTERDMGNS